MKKLIYHSTENDVRVPEGTIYYNMGGYDGSLRYKGATTLSRYFELKRECEEHHHEGIFYAFSNEQFAEGLREIGIDIAPGLSVSEVADIAKANKILSLGHGCFGTKENIEKMLNYYEENNDRIKQECDPQDIYMDEYVNHESHYHGDREAFYIVKLIFGDEIASQIQRI